MNGRTRTHSSTSWPGHLSLETCRALVYAAASRLPIALTRDPQIAGRIERIATTVLVDHLVELRHGRPGDIRCATAGFPPALLGCGA